MSVRSTSRPIEHLQSSKIHRKRQAHGEQGEQRGRDRDGRKGDHPVQHARNDLKKEIKNPTQETRHGDGSDGALEDRRV